MTVPTPQSAPLNYEARRAHRRRSRALTVALLGGVIASAGIVVFLFAHQIVAKDYDSLPAEHARLHESLWSAFGIALLLAGAAIAAVGLGSWCRAEVG